MVCSNHGWHTAGGKAGTVGTVHTVATSSLSASAHRKFSKLRAEHLPPIKVPLYISYSTITICAVRGFVRTHFLPFTRSGRESRTTLHLTNLWKTQPVLGSTLLFCYFDLIFAGFCTAGRITWKK